MSKLTLSLNPLAARHRRASIRYRCDRPPTRRVFLVESYQTMSADVRDLSAGGVGLKCDRALDAGSLLFVDLIGMGMGVEFLARVVHSTPCEAGEWLVGCRFERPLTSDELNLILVGQR